MLETWRYNDFINDKLSLIPIMAWLQLDILTYWGQDEMANNLQSTYSN